MKQTLILPALVVVMGGAVVLGATPTFDAVANGKRMM